MCFCFSTDNDMLLQKYFMCSTCIFFYSVKEAFLYQIHICKWSVRNEKCITFEIPQIKEHLFHFLITKIKSPFSFFTFAHCFYGNTKISGCYIRPQPTFENHISHVTKTALSHLRNIAKLRNMLTVSDAEQLVHAFMTSRLDYWNALLGGCPVDLHLHFGNMFQ